MQPVTLIVSHNALRIIAGHFPPAPSDAFLDFDPILPGWPEEPGSEGTTASPGFGFGGDNRWATPGTQRLSGHPATMT